MASLVTLVVASLRGVGGCRAGYDTLTRGGRAVCNHYRGEHCLACVALVRERYIPGCFCVSEGVEF